MIPLDCDEFLAVMTPSDIRCDKSSILNELRWFIGTPHTIGIKMEFRNSYRYKDYFYMLDCNKTVFSGGEICAIDHGFHTAGTKTREIINSRLCHIHLHNKPYRRLMKDTRQKLQALGVDTSDPGAIASTQHSWHLLEYFKKSEHDILREIDQHAHIHIPGFGRLIDDLGASLSFAHELDCGSPPPLVVPTPFDHEAYLDRYADVRWSGLSPLYHGLAYGAKERRIMDRLMESTPDMESGMKEEALELPA